MGAGQALAIDKAPQAALLDALEMDVDRLIAVGLRDMGVPELAEYQRRIRRSMDRLEYQSGRALSAFDAADGGRLAAGDTVGWMKTELKLGPGAAWERLLVARRLEAHPDTAAKLSTGEISYEQAAIVARSTVEVAPADAAKVEERLLGAMDMEPGRLRLHARAVVAEIDAEELRRDSRRAWGKRSLRIGPDINGSASVCGHLTSEAAAYWRASTEPFMRPTGMDDERTADQRLHDATLQVLKGAGAGAGKGRRPQLVVTAPLSALLQEGGPPALLQGMVPISPEELDQCRCEGDLTIVLKDARGNIAYQGRRSRRFSPAKRRAIVTANPTCVWPGCGRPALESDIHHVDEVNEGGETTVDNGAPACWQHHPKIHKEGWGLVRQPGGGFIPVPPGHPDNPRTGLSSEEYLRRRMLGIRASRDKESKRRGADEPDRASGAGDRPRGPGPPAA